MTKIIVASIISITLISSCKKTDTVYSNSSINVIQAIADVPSAYVYFTETPLDFYQHKNPINYLSSLEYGIPSGATPLSIVNSADTTIPVFQATLTTKPGGIYSLFLAGQTKAIDTVYTQDQIPYYTDSLAGIRFINLSQGSQPVSINLVDATPGQKEVSNLGYKQITNFKSYPATLDIGGVYNFEIRDQASDSLLTTYSWYYSLQKNNTIVISGTESNGLTLFAVNNY